MSDVRVNKPLNVRMQDLVLAPLRAKNRNRLWLARQPAATHEAYHHMVSTTAPPALYVKVGKAANSTIINIMHYLEKGSMYEGNLFHDNVALTQGMINVIENARRYRSSDYFTFSFVRNPESRIYSSFKNLFLEATNDAGDYHIRYLNSMGFQRCASAEEKFDCFLDYLEACMEKGPMLVDFHFRPQTLSLGMPDMTYDFIGKVERFDKDMSHVLDQLEVEPSTRSEIAGMRVNVSSSQASRLTPSQQARVRRLYADDFEAFGYD